MGRHCPGLGAPGGHVRHRLLSLTERTGDPVMDRNFICPCDRHKQDIADTGRCICGLFVGRGYRRAKTIEAPPIRQQDSSWPLIVVYGTSWCHDTRRTCNFLNRNGIPYRIVDLDDDDAAAQRVMDWNDGYQSMPTLDIGGRIVAEPSDAELAQVLGLT